MYPVCMFQPHLMWSHTMARKCACIRRCMHIHLTPQILSKLLCIVVHKHVYPCVALAHFPATPYLVPHLSQSVFINQYIFAFLLIPHLCSIPFSKIPKCVHPCVAPYAYPSHPLHGYIPWPQGTHAPVYVYMFSHVQPTYCSCLYGNMCTLCAHPSHLLSSSIPYPVYMYQYMSVCPPQTLFLLHPLCIVAQKHMCPCVAHVHLATTPHLVPCLGQKVYMHQSMYVCPPHCLGSGPMHIADHRKLICTCRSYI